MPLPLVGWRALAVLIYPPPAGGRWHEVPEGGYLIAAAPYIQTRRI